jgi:uncharacterized protein YutE (UPF0331/DUF86 family)
MHDEQKRDHMLEQSQQAMQNLTIALSASAAVQLAAEFYTKEERVELIAQYQSLRLAVQTARDVHNSSIEAGADAEVKQSNFKALRQADAIKDEFAQRHGLIAALCRAKTSFETPLK